jgi:uncharacterized protein (DUF2225 family)
MSKKKTSRVASVMTGETVCPICFTVFRKGSIPAEYPACPHCESEAIGADVQNIEHFLRENTVGALQELLSRWQKAAGFNPQYKSAKAGRIRAMIERKKRHRA